MHRADQIIDAIVLRIKEHADGQFQVFAHRRYSLDEEDCPAISVDFGEDVPTGDSGYADLSGLVESLLTVNVTGVVFEVEEPLVRRQLLALRAASHIAIKSVSSIGLAFVQGVHYGGANPPDVDAEGDMIAGELTSSWGIQYEMKPNTPE